MKRARDAKKIPDPATEIKLFCGFDWARHDHYFVLKNASHEVLDEGYFPNSPDGFADFFARLDAHRKGRSIALIIEATRGAATSVLATVGWIRIYPLNPSKTRKLIELDGSGKGKNDQRDSHLLCDHLIANHHKLRPDTESDEDILCLRELILTEDEYIADQTRLKNRIKAQISQFCPNLEEMVGEKLDTKAYTQYLLSFDLRQLADADQVAEHLRKHHVRSEKVIEGFIGKHSMLELLPLGEKLLAIHCEKLRGLVRQLHAIQEELEACQGEITTYFNELPNAEIYRSQPGLGERLAPRMAAFFGKDPSNNFASKQQAAAYFGQSPVTESTGGYDQADGKRDNRSPAKKTVKKRNSCNGRARHTAYLWSRAIGCLKEVNAPWQRSYLDRLKGRGDKAATRYRKLGKKMIAVLYTCLLNNQPYSLEVYEKNSHAS
jgi:transposase